MGIRVLICDDSAFARQRLKIAFPRDCGVEFEETAEGAQALQRFRSGEVDLAFLDLNMPGMTGYDVLEQMQDEGLKVPVVVISADIQRKAQERVLGLGAVAFLRKPVTRQQVEPLLADVLGASNSANPL